MPDRGHIAGWIERWADHRPDALAIEFEGHAQTYRELDARIHAAAHWLAARGVGRGHRVGFLGPNRPEVFELLFACARLGAIYLPLNSRLTPVEHSWIIDDATPTLVVADRAFEDHLGQLALAIADPAVDYLDAATTDWGPSGPSDLPVGALSDPVLLAYTSGTTGHPKGALLDQNALLFNALNGAHAHDLTSHDRVLTLLPLFHVGGLNIQSLPTFHAGGAVLLHRTFDPGLWLDDVERWSPSWSLLVPATLTAVAQHPRFAGADLGSLSGLMTGSSTVPEAVVRPFLDRGIGVGQIYGSTETAPTAIFLRADQSFERPTSCGKPAIHCDVRIVDRTDPTSEVPDGDSGELLVRGANVLREYWGNPEATAEAFVDGWFRTGDIGHRDHEGWFHIDDRSKDVIISGGENVYPAELEFVLADAGLVAEFTVVGVPDERWGEVPVIVAADPAIEPERRPDVGDRLIAACAASLARFKVPKTVRWLDALPRTALGKVQKHEVRDRLVGPT